MLTYNIDSRKPCDLDVDFLEEFVENHEADIYVFGFQELVDLENVCVFGNGRKESMQRRFWLDPIKLQRLLTLLLTKDSSFGPIN